MDPSSTKIILGIPTRGRPATVARCLQSFVGNAEAHGREATFFVVDDNHFQKDADETREQIEAIAQASKLPIRYLDRGDRTKMATSIAVKAKLPLELLEFALLGDERCRSSYGAARNTLLLASAGCLHVQVDDDTICDLFSTAEGFQNLVAPDELPADHYQFFQSRAEALAVARGFSSDLLGLYEAYLGKPLTSLTNATANYPPEASVVSTCLGATGDSGMSTTMGRLSFPGPPAGCADRRSCDLQMETVYPQHHPRPTGSTNRYRPRTHHD